MSFIVSPLDKGYYTIARGPAFFYPAGSPDKGVQLGDAAAGAITVAAESQPINSTEDGSGSVIHQINTRPSLTGSIGLRMMTDFNVAIANASDVATFSQSAATGSSQAVTGVAVGDIIKIGGPLVRNVDSVVITDGESTPVPYVLGTDYEINTIKGLIKIIAIPDGAGSNLAITYNTGAITAGAQIGPGSNLDKRGRFEFLANTDTGKKFDCIIWDCQLVPEGEQTIIQDGIEIKVLNVTLNAFKDTTKAAAYQLGQMIRTE